MNTAEARDLGEQLAALAAEGRIAEACTLLDPVLAGRTPFRLLDEIGAGVGRLPPQDAAPLLEQIAAGRTMGGWIVIASALHGQLESDLPGAFERCRGYILQADAWYATDSFGERVPGPALVTTFEAALAQLTPWREDSNRWVRRATGVAVHFWAKRSRGDPALRPQAAALLDLLDPLFEERNPDAVKGAGWGLKSLGRYYPDLIAEWLPRQSGRPHRALMLRKAKKYLPE